MQILVYYITWGFLWTMSIPKTFFWSTHFFWVEAVAVAVAPSRPSYIQTWSPTIASSQPASVVAFGLKRSNCWTSWSRLPTGEKTQGLSHSSMYSWMLMWFVRVDSETETKFELRNREWILVGWMCFPYSREKTGNFCGLWYCVYLFMCF